MQKASGNMVGRHKKRLHEYEEDRYLRAAKARKEGGVSLACHKPSYCLIQGVGNRTERGVHNESIRSGHRKRLWRILNELMQRHNWTEASGVLAVLLLGTAKDCLPSRNRVKYSAALELLNFIKGDSRLPTKTEKEEVSLQNVYVLWMKKLKHWSPKIRFAVQFEIIMSYFQRGATEDARQAVLHLMQEDGFDSDPVSHLVVGLAFYQLWYSSILKEFQLTTDRNSSAANDEEASVDVDSKRKESKDNDVTTRIETSHFDVQSKEFSLHSAEGSEHSDDSLPNSHDLPDVSTLCTQGLPLWLLPFKSPDSQSSDDAIHNYYRKALKHLRFALDSTPPVLEAFHPLIQMLLLRDEGREACKALDEYKSMFDSSGTILQLKLKAAILEHFDSGNHMKMFEDILEKDPTCSDSLRRLIHMNHRGDYDAQNLAEMIALHLDATHGARDAWKELASCLFRLSQCEGDRVSTCHDGSNRHGPDQYLDNSNKIPELFMNSDSAKKWRFRCRWWLNRHFSNNVLMTDIASGDLELLTYKASTACHLYGRHFKYVVKATECLEKENNVELYSFLQMHSLNSVGFYSVKRNTC